MPSAQREKVVTYTGRIRELDKDKRSFELREIEEASVEMQRFTFDEELAEDVLDAFHENLRVIAVGTPYPITNVAQLAALTKLETNTGEDVS